MRLVIALAALGAVLTAGFAVHARATPPPATAEVCASAFAETRAVNSIDAYDRFIRDYPTCPQVEDARQRRSALAAGPTRGFKPKRATAPPEPTAGDSPAPGSASESVVVTQIKPVFTDIGPTQKRIAANGGSAVVLLSENTAAAPRNRATCQAIMKLFDPASIQQVEIGARRNPRTGVIELLRPVYWMLSQDRLQSSELRDCERRLTQYNYRRAATIRDKMNLQGAGPYLLVQREDESRAGVMDLSRVAPGDIEKLVLVFRNNFSQRGDIWDQGAYTIASRRQRLESTLGAVFPSEFVAAIAFVVDPPTRLGCLRGDLSDTPCTHAVPR